MTQASKLTESEKAWLACAIDGEGSIFISKHKHSERVLDSGETKVYHNYKYGIVVYNTDIRFVQEAANLLGGANVRKCGSAKSTNLWKNPKQMYQVQIARHEKVLKILKLIRPYLIIKKDKADELIKFIESHNWRKSYHPEMARQ